MTYQIIQGDCIEVMKTLSADSVDAVVCDPPYGIRFMGKAWDGADIDKMAQTKMRKETVRTDGYKRNDGAAFAAGAYDTTITGNRAFQEWTSLWGIEALRVLKPGGYIVVFAAPRTYHRMVSGLEDAGFEIRDQIMWIFGSGFPKSHNVSKGIDKSVRAEWFRENAEALRSIIPANNYHDWTIGGHAPSDKWWVEIKELVGGGHLDPNIVAVIEKAPGWYTSNDKYNITTPKTEFASKWSGWGTALKPAHEPILLARKPFNGSVAKNIKNHGVGAINIDACRIGAENRIYDQYGAAEAVDYKKGRWPGNIIHDGSHEVLTCFPDTKSGKPSGVKAGGQGHVYGDFAGGIPVTGVGDEGSASRFFYCAKTTKLDRDEGITDAPKEFVQFQTKNGTSGKASSLSKGRDTKYKNIHPTVKPTDLMRYLCRLVTPRGGIILDPFMGSGSTGKAAVLEQFNFIGIELSDEYLPIAKQRIAFAAGEIFDGASHG